MTTATRKIIDSQIASTQRRVWRRKRLWEVGILTGLGLIVVALAGCGAAGSGGWGSPEITEAIGGLGAAAGSAGTMSGNPILFGLGAVLTSYASWKRLRAGGSPSVPPTAPPV